jgi:phosphoribosylformylglycinamidine synthase
LNFGNPYDPQVYYQFVYAIKGMSEACKKFDTPVTGGNVSFYNQNPDGAVYPTPTIGMVGLLDSPNDKMTMDFKKAGDLVFLIGKSRNDINSSEYLHKIKQVEYSPAPYFDIEEEATLQNKIAELIKAGAIQSAHDISEGGLFVTLIESCFNRNLGIDVVAGNIQIRKDAYWFGEAQSRVVVSVNPANIDVFKKVIGDHPCEELGEVTSGSIEVDGLNWGTIQTWKEKYDTAIENLLTAHESDHALSAL